jgi:hypothetical protein
MVMRRCRYWSYRYWSYLGRPEPDPRRFAYRASQCTRHLSVQDVTRLRNAIDPLGCPSCSEPRPVQRPTKVDSRSLLGSGLVARFGHDAQVMLALDHRHPGYDALLAVLRAMDGTNPEPSPTVSVPLPPISISPDGPLGHWSYPRSASSSGSSRRKIRFRWNAHSALARHLELHGQDGSDGPRSPGRVGAYPVGCRSMWLSDRQLPTCAT